MAPKKKVTKDSPAKKKKRGGKRKASEPTSEPTAAEATVETPEPVQTPMKVKNAKKPTIKVQALIHSRAQGPTDDVEADAESAGSPGSPAGSERSERSPSPAQREAGSSHGTSAATSTAPTSTAPTTTTATTPAVTTTTAAITGEGSQEVVEEEEGPVENPLDDPPPEEEEEEQASTGKGKGKGKGKKSKAKGKGKPKADKNQWTLPPKDEQDVIEWLKGNNYLWLRSTHDYKKKRQAWEMKAEELNVTYEHLQKWWKNLKDWYLRLRQKASGQASKVLTDREKWVLASLSFYKSAIPTETPDTLTNLARAPTAAASSAASAAAASSSQPLPSLDTQESVDDNILEDMENAAAELASTTSSHKGRKRRRKDEEEEDSMMKELRKTMQKNQELLERLLDDREKAKSDREPFIRYVCDSLRTIPHEQYHAMKELITDILRSGGQGEQRDSQGASTSFARPGPSVSAPPACTASSQPFSQYSPSGYSQPYSQQQQQYYQPQPNYDACSTWQYRAGYQQQQQQQLPPQQQQQASQQQQQQPQQLHTPYRPPRESAESVGRLLGAAITGEDWNFLDNSGVPRSSQVPTLNTPPAPRASPGQRGVVSGQPSQETESQNASDSEDEES